jgi:DNA repair protein RecO (recombination protein O)
VPRPRTYRVEAIVLRRVDFGEADRVLVLFTRERGKLAVVAKGVRRISSRMAGHLELFTQSELQLAKGANLDVVTQAETRNAFRALREDLTRTSTAYLIVELADALTEEALEQPELYDLLTATFRALGTSEDPRLVAAHFQLRLLDVAGFRPVLMQCVVCHADLAPGRNAFSAFLGGALCPACGPGEPSARPIDTDVLKVLRNLQRAGLPGSAHFRVPEVVMREVERILRDIVERHTERRLRTPDLLARLRTEPALAPAPPAARPDDLATAEPAPPAAPVHSPGL